MERNVFVKKRGLLSLLVVMAKPSKNKVAAIAKRANTSCSTLGIRSVQLPNDIRSRDELGGDLNSSLSTLNLRARYWPLLLAGGLAWMG